MILNFTKMHGLGNDYLYVDCTMYEPFNLPFDPCQVAIDVSPRYTSVGSDGLILICRSNCADFMMRMFNADGSEGKMCGNGIRCVGKFIHDKGLSPKLNLSVETLSGIKHLDLHLAEDGTVDLVTVDMGKAVSEEMSLTVNDTTYNGVSVNMGNPHFVNFIEEPVAKFPLEVVGPLMETNPAFPQGVNAEFVNCLDTGVMQMRVWERGSAETMACGTGACAVAVAAKVRNMPADANGLYHVRVKYGELQIRIDDEWNVTMTGPAAISFEGSFSEPHRRC